MEQKTHSQTFLRRRKLLLVLPLLALPFLMLLFYSLGGGSGNADNAQQAKNGLNMQLPGANLKDDKPLDKLSYYEKAASDTLKLQELQGADPYFRRRVDTFLKPPIDTSLSENRYRTGQNVGRSQTVNSQSAYSDPNEAKVYQKLAQLDAALDKASSSNRTTTKGSVIVESSPATSVNSKDVYRLEGLMQNMNQKQESDPEVQELNGMLEKILDIQHPDRVREKIKQTSVAKKGQVFPVTVNSSNDPVSLLESREALGQKKPSGSKPSEQTNGFFSLTDESLTNEQQNAIQAVVHETQTLVNGSTVKLRLLNDVFINGVLIPKKSFLFGTADLNVERLGIKIKSIRFRNSLFPVDLSACDMDGMEGIYIPGAISRDVAKQTLDRSSQAIDITTLNTSIGAQAAGVGIETAKTLLGRKVKLVKVTVKAGYQVLLRDERQKENSR